MILSLIMILSFSTGCLFRSSSNPVGTSEISQNQQLAQNAAQVKPKVMAATYAKPAGRNYTFSKCGHKVNHKFRENLKKLAGSLNIRLLSADSTEKINITFEKMKVKPEKGSPINIKFDKTTINLLDVTHLSDSIADAELPDGVYNYLEFYVKEANVEDANGTHPMVVPSKRIRFFGQFEIKEGYSTVLTIKFLHRIIKWKIFSKQFYMMIPIVKISSSLELKPVDSTITDGDLNGHVENFVSAAKLEGVSVSLQGTTYSAVTGADGSFSFTEVPAGLYTLVANHPDYLDYSFQMEIVAGQEATVVAQLNPAVIRSTVGNTGWFSEFFPLADANGTYAEAALETPIQIDFVSLAFTRAEIKFIGQYNAPGAARFHSYFALNQQVSADTDLGTWWVGWNASLGSELGLFYATPEGNEYTIDVTDLVRNSPSSAYYLAARNLDFVDIRLNDIQLSIYYR